MNTIKKIIIVVTISIVISLSISLTGCSSKPTEEFVKKTTEEVVTKEETKPTIEEEIDEILDEFLDIYDSYLTLCRRESGFNNQYNTVFYKIMHLVGKQIDAVEESKPTKFSVDELLLYEGAGGALDKIEKMNETVKQQDSKISELQERAIKITDSTKKTLAQEIVDKLIKLNSLKNEKLDLYKNLTTCLYYGALALHGYAEGKIPTIELNAALKELGPGIEVFSKRLVEVEEELDVLQNEILDFKAKLDNLGP